jgi:hypothetical protein
VSRRSRIPGTTSVWRRDIATAGNPTSALVEALKELRAVRTGQVWSVGIGHDAACPSLKDGGIPACTCEIIWLEARRAA